MLSSEQLQISWPGYRLNPLTWTQSSPRRFKRVGFVKLGLPLKLLILRTSTSLHAFSKPSAICWFWGFPNMSNMFQCTICTYCIILPFARRPTKHFPPPDGKLVSSWKLSSAVSQWPKTADQCLLWHAYGRCRQDTLAPERPAASVPLQSQLLRDHGRACPKVDFKIRCGKIHGVVMYG